MEEDIKGFQIQEEDQRGGGRGGGFSKQNQNQNNQQHHRQPPPQQPQKCPRCESLNTKFCYYNNYSLSQPRYFCKTCRRYWTQGGTLRNVPVGGGCRKGKRLKRSSSPSPSHQPNQMISLPSTDGVIDSSRYKSNDTSTASLLPPFTFPGGGFLSSLGVGGGGIQSFNGEFGGSNLALLQGFSHHHPSYLNQHQQLQLQQQQQNLQFHQIPTATTHVFNMGGSRESLEENDGTEPNRPSTPHHQEWSQSPVMTSEAGYWSSTTNRVNTSTTAAATTNSVGSLNLNQTHHWGDLPGFGAPPSNSSSSPSFL